ncbi:unnamed protein product [Ixodes persulcatus]
MRDTQEVYAPQIMVLNSVRTIGGSSRRSRYLCVKCVWPILNRQRTTWKKRSTTGIRPLLIGFPTWSLLLVRQAHFSCHLHPTISLWLLCILVRYVASQHSL